MSKIIVNITNRKNKKHILEAQKGRTLMQLIDQHELANPYGICGGEPMCGTCHVYVEKEWLDKLNPKTSEEELAIDNASELKENSRCGCQIDLIEELNGLTVTIGPNENQI
jgi:2Fe-2S ferredoxin